MILQQYIQEALFKKQFCVVPQLGTFSLQRFPAQYNTTTQTITAPYEQVTFTQQWQEDDACAEWIALKENLLLAAAQKKMEKYVETLKASLQSGQPLVLPGIGKLQGDFAGNIQLQPEILPAGQDVLSVLPIQRPGMAVPPPPAAQHTPPLEPLMTTEMEETLEAVTIGSGFKWWWAGIPIAMIIVGLAVWWFVTYSPASVTNTVNAPVENIDSIQHTAISDSLKPEAVAPVAVVPPPDTLEYFAVVAEYHDSLKAARQTARRKAWNQQVIMYKRDNVYKVAAPVRSAASDTTIELEKKKAEYKNNKVYLDF